MNNTLLLAFSHLALLVFLKLLPQHELEIKHISLKSRKLRGSVKKLRFDLTFHWKDSVRLKL